MMAINLRKFIFGKHCIQKDFTEKDSYYLQRKVKKFSILC